MKKRADGKKRAEVVGGRLVLRAGDKEIKGSLVGVLLVLIAAGAMLLCFYSDWKCGSCVHDASDMPFHGAHK